MYIYEIQCIFVVSCFIISKGQICSMVLSHLLRKLGDMVGCVQNMMKFWKLQHFDTLHGSVGLCYCSSSLAWKTQTQHGPFFIAYTSKLPSQIIHTPFMPNGSDYSEYIQLLFCYNNSTQSLAWYYSYFMIWTTFLQYVEPFIKANFNRRKSITYP